MTIKISNLPNSELYTIVPEIHRDHRGYFQELFNIDEHMMSPIRQISESVSHKYTFRGMHRQPGMYKYMRVVTGAAMVIAVNVDIYYKNEKNTDYLKPQYVFLSEYINLLLVVPDFYYVGFITYADNTRMLYAQTDTFKPQKAQVAHYSSFNGLEQFLTFYKNEGWNISDQDARAPMFTPS